MTITVGDALPDATLIKMGEDGPESVELSDYLKGHKAVLFGIPAAFSGTCSQAHMPSFIRTRDKFSERGVDDVICISVNDPFVLDAWDKAMGARAAGITLLGDPGSHFTKAIGMDFTAPPAGLYGRSKRYVMVVEDGMVRILNEEDNPGECSVSTGEALLDML